MSNKLVTYITILLVVLVVAVPMYMFLDNGNERNSSADSTSTLSQYIIKGELNIENKTLTVKQNIKYTNSEAVELKELYFHVYTNAFKNQETAPFLFDDFDKAYRNGFESGYTEISSVKLVNRKNTSKLNYELQGDGNTILKLELPEGLQSGQSIDLELQYVIHIPSALERFGYGDKCINLGNWYPIVAVYDETGWNLDKYYAIGDPFYSEASNYQVELIVPTGYVVAGSGQFDKKVELAGDRAVWRFKAENMRDFALVVSSSFEVNESKVGETTVKTYYYPEDAERGKAALKIAIETIETYNDAFGKYPYPTYSVVETQFPSGMEYPGLVYISKDLYNDSSSFDAFLLTVVHETAHQWWYGAVGNDQIDEAWLDESFATFSEAVYVEKKFGKKIVTNFITYMEDHTQDAISKKAFDGKILKSLAEFKNWEDYGPAVYDAGALVLWDIRNTLGDKVFFEALKEYYRDNTFKIATTKNFIEHCESVSGKELDGLFDKWLGVQ